MQHEAVLHGEVVQAVGSLHDRALALDVLVEGPPVAALSSDVVPAVVFCHAGRSGSQPR